MRNNVPLTVASLLSILLVTFHMADDIVRGMEKGGPWDLTIIPVLVLWLYGTVALAGRRSGYVIILIGALLVLVIPVIHFMGRHGVAGGGIAESAGGFFFVWTLVALGVTAVFSVILAVRGLFRPARPSDAGAGS